MTVFVYNPYGFSRFSVTEQTLNQIKSIKIVTSMNGIHLNEASALLIPSGNNMLDRNDIINIREWVCEGGNLLLLSAMGGDLAPHGYRDHRTNISALLPRYAFANNSLGEVVNDPRYPGAFGFHSITHFMAVGMPISGINIRYPHGCSLEPTQLNKWGGVVRELWRVTASNNCYELNNFNIPGLKYRAHPHTPLRQALCGLKQSVDNGTVTAWGSSYSFSDDFLVNPSNLEFILWLLGEWLEKEALAEDVKGNIRTEAVNLLRDHIAKEEDVYTNFDESKKIHMG